VARSVHRTWYRVAIARPGAKALIVAAQGAHLGEAIAAAQAHTRSYAIAADLAGADVIPLGESVGKQQVVELGDDPHDTPSFRWPAGVLPQLGHATAVAGARRGFAIRPHATLLVIEAQTDAEHLVDLFLGLVERLPSADNLEVRVLDHFEDAGRTDVWLTSRVNANKILRFLDDHDVELLGNGHLEISVYVRAHQATLRLTEHRSVVWLAEQRALEREVIGWLDELRVPRVDARAGVVGEGDAGIDGLVTVDRASHFHYRPASSRDRKQLGDELYRQRLRRVDTR
jgi:hypothetical protein